MTPADFEAKATIVDDPLERHVMVSTAGAFRGNRASNKLAASALHVRAVVDRQSGATRFQVWQDIAYWGGRKDVYQVNYLASGTLRETSLIAVAHRPDDCPMVDAIGSCILNKTLAFELDEVVAREIADIYQPGSRAAWTFRFKDRLGNDVTSGIAPAEMSGLLRTLDKWRSGRSISDIAS